MLRSERVAVCLVGQKGFLVLDRGERDVRGEPPLRVGDDETGTRLRLDELRELTPMDATEARVEAAPARDAVDVHRDLDGRQLLELAPGQAERLLDFAADREVPRREVGLGHRARVEDGPF